jgi:hypothetical protein
MKPLVVSCIFLMLLLIAEGVNAQWQLLNFHLVSCANGISLEKINGITQDKIRYVWFVDQTKLTALWFQTD